MSANAVSNVPSFINALAVGLPLHSILTCSGGNSTTLSKKTVCTQDMCGDGIALD